MDITLYFFLPMILFLGIVTSYEDIKGRGIRNKWIILSLAYSFLMLFLIIVYLFVSGQEIISGYIPDFIINVAISLAFGFVIWKAGFWSAGDGKLFLAYSALIPLSTYSIGYVRFFPSFALFINILLPVFVFLVAGLLLKTNLKEKISTLKGTFNKKILMTVIMSLFGISWLIRVMFQVLGMEYDLFNFLILVPIAYMVLMMLAGEKIKWLFPILVVLRIVFDYEFILSMGFVYRFIFVIIFFVFIRYFIFGLSNEFFSKRVDIQQIRTGMILADAIYKDGDKYTAKPQDFMSISKSQSTGKPVIGAKVLTMDNVEKIKKLHRSGKIGQHLRIQATMPFAIFMFLGVLLTIAFNGNLIFVLKGLLGYG